MKPDLHSINTNYLTEKGKTDNYTYDVLLKWLVEDYAKGNLAPGDLRRIFLPGESEHSEHYEVSDGIKLLSLLDIKSLCRKSLPVASAEVSSDMNIDVLDLWLFCTELYVESDRQYIIIRLQYDRVQSFNFDNDPLYIEAYAAALERLLSLFPCICNEVQGLFSSINHTFWETLGDILCSLCYGSTERLMSDESEIRLNKALHALHQSLKYLWPTDSLYVQGTRHVAIARVYRIQRLRGSSIAFDERLRSLREAEECFDEVRLDYTLLGDLEGLERHSGLSSRYPTSQPLPNGGQIFLDTLRS